MTSWVRDNATMDDLTYEFRMIFIPDSNGVIAKTQLWTRKVLRHGDEEYYGSPIKISKPYNSNSKTPDVVIIQYNRSNIPYVLRAHMRRAGLYRVENSERIFHQGDSFEKIHLKPEFYNSQLKMYQNNS